MNQNLFRPGNTNDLFRAPNNAIFSTQPQQQQTYQNNTWYNPNSNTWPPANTTQGQVSSKLGTYRAHLHDPNKFNGTATMPPPNKTWNERSIPMSVSIGDGTGNLSLLQLRIEDYYLIKTNGLTQQHRKTLKEGTDKRQVNQQYLRSPTSWQPTTLSYEAKPQSNLHSTRGTANNTGAPYNQPTNPYSQTSNNLYTSYNQQQPINPFNSQQNNQLNQPTNPFAQQSTTPVNPFATNTLMNNTTTQTNIWRNSQVTQPNQTTSPQNIFLNNPNSSIRMTSSTTTTNPNIFTNQSTNNSNNLFANTTPQQQPVNIFANQNSTPNYFAQNTQNNNIFQQPQNSSINLFANTSPAANIFSSNQQQQPNIFNSQQQVPMMDQQVHSTLPNSLFGNSMTVQAAYQIPMRKRVFSSTSMDMRPTPRGITGPGDFMQPQIDQTLLMNCLQNFFSAMIRKENLYNSSYSNNSSSQSAVFSPYTTNSFNYPGDQPNQFQGTHGTVYGEQAPKQFFKIEEIPQQHKLRLRKLIIVNEQQQHPKQNPFVPSLKHKKPEYTSIYNQSEIQKSIRPVERQSIFSNQPSELPPIKADNKTRIEVMEGNQEVRSLLLQIQDVNPVEAISNELIRLGVIRRNQSVEITGLYLGSYPKITCSIKRKKINLPSGYRSKPENPVSDVVQNLEISNQNGKIRWLSPVNIAEIDFSNIIQIGRSEVEIYNDQSTKPPPGKGLNLPCQVTMYYCDMVELLRKSNGGKDKIPKKLRAACQKQGVQFVSYNDSDGSWTFKMAQLP